MVKDALDEIDQIHAEHGKAIARSLADVALAEMRDDQIALRAAMTKLTIRLAKSSAVADLFGRRRLILEIEADTKTRQFGLRDVSFIPKIPFAEAIDEIIGRRPVLARGWIAAKEAYQRGAFAVARSASVIVTRHIKKTIAQALERGQDSSVVTNEIAEALGARQLDGRGASFVQSYADTVFRTNTTSAYAAGRRQQALDPEVAPFIGGWRFDATNDSDVRPNHLAADNFAAATNDPVWNTLTPPLGYNCRCALSVITRRQAKKLGIFTPGEGVNFKTKPVGAGPDKGFASGAASSVYS